MSIEDRIVFEKMLEAMCIASDFEREELLSHRKNKPQLAPCRFFIWYHLSRDKRWSLSEIGRAFGRSHATIYHGIQLVDSIITLHCYDKEQEIYDEFINNLCVLL